MHRFVLLLTAVLVLALSAPAFAHDGQHGTPSNRDTLVDKERVGKIKGHPQAHNRPHGEARAVAADVSPQLQYAKDSLRGLTGQAPDNDVGRRIEYLENTQFPGINIYDWRWVTSWRTNDHHLHIVIEYWYKTCNACPHAGELRDTAHAYVDWPHTPSLRVYRDGFAH